MESNDVRAGKIKALQQVLDQMTKIKKDPQAFSRIYLIVKGLLAMYQREIKEEQEQSEKI